MFLIKVFKSIYIFDNQCRPVCPKPQSKKMEFVDSVINTGYSLMAIWNINLM